MNDVLILQTAGQNKENADFREALSLQRGFEAIGINADVSGPGYDDPPKSKYDIFFVMENYDFSWFADLKNENVAFWSIDAHCNYDNHCRFIETHRPEYVFVAPKPMAEKLGGVWLPNAYPQDLIFPKETPLRYDVGYCGSLGPPLRSMFLVRLQAHSNMRLDMGILGENMVDCLRSYNIGFNQNVGIDVNYRTFETMGSGAMLLTNETPGLLDLFQHEYHLVTYSNYNDCVDKIQYYTKNPELRDTIAKQGYECVVANHTYKNRAKQIVDYIEGGQNEFSA